MTTKANLIGCFSLGVGRFHSKASFWVYKSIDSGLSIHIDTQNIEHPEFNKSKEIARSVNSVKLLLTLFLEQSADFPVITGKSDQLVKIINSRVVSEIQKIEGIDILLNLEDIQQLTMKENIISKESIFPNKSQILYGQYMATQAIVDYLEAIRVELDQFLINPLISIVTRYLV